MPGIHQFATSRTKKHKAEPSIVGATATVAACYRKAKISAADVLVSSPSTAHISEFANASRTLQRRLRSESKLHPVYTRQITQWDKTINGKIQRDCAFLPVHETFAKLCSSDWCLDSGQHGLKKELTEFIHKFKLETNAQL